MPGKITALAAFAAAVRAQNACTLTSETQPSVSWQQCDDSGCTDVAGSIVLDSNWRWTHTVSGSTNCYSGNSWDSSICPDPETCSEACCVDGGDYPGTYGINAGGSAVDLTFVTDHAYGTNVGSRVYLMEDSDSYQMFNLLGNEFTFDVDVSNLPCGLNGALYFVSMEQDGGLSSFEYNNAGARYGTGYCDSQCPRDVKFIAGLANIDDWTSSSNDANSGVGKMGACCSEMDIWEANSISNAYTPHPCDSIGYHTCEGDSCGGTYSSERYAGTCDPDGCDFNPYRQGNETFYGPGSIVDTTQPMTVVTQFHADGSGELSEIKRFYVQNGQVIANADSVYPASGNSITTEYCDAQKVAFGDTDTFSQHGGLAQMGADLSAMVLVLSLWDDHYANMLWLDSTYPVDSTADGAVRGTCATTSGVPADVEEDHPNANVVFSNIKFGTIGSTFSGDGDDGGEQGSTTTTTTTTQPPVSTTTPGASDTTTEPPASTTTPATGGVALYGQCGGNAYSGETSCATGCCQAWSEWYHQCIPGPCT